MGRAAAVLTIPQLCARNAPRREAPGARRAGFPVLACSAPARCLSGARPGARAGWGSSFHFAHRWANESHSESLKRHEHFLALKLKIEKDTKVLDVGCGIGGPMREIALFSNCYITGERAGATTTAPAEPLPGTRPGSPWPAPPSSPAPRLAQA
jgi:hypothetical protein